MLMLTLYGTVPLNQSSSPGISGGGGGAEEVKNGGQKDSSEHILEFPCAFTHQLCIVRNVDICLNIQHHLAGASRVQSRFLLLHFRCAQENWPAL